MTTCHLLNVSLSRGNCRSLRAKVRCSRTVIKRRKMFAKTFLGGKIQSAVAKGGTCFDLYVPICTPNKSLHVQYTMWLVVGEVLCTCAFVCSCRCLLWRLPYTRCITSNDNYLSELVRISQH